MYKNELSEGTACVVVRFEDDEEKKALLDYLQDNDYKGTWKGPEGFGGICNWYWVNISVPGWVKFSFYKETWNKIIFNKKRGTENEYSHNGIMNFEKIDTIWISTLYNDIIIPIDTNKTTTEKIPLPF